MHLTMILLTLGGVWLLRCCWHPGTGSWPDRWQSALLALLLPPLLLGSTSVAVLCMGVQGQMLGLPVGRLGYGLAIGALASASGLLLLLAWQAERSRRQICTYPVQEVQGVPSRVVPLATPFAAQIGIWQPQLLVSQGLLDSLSRFHLEAVLRHEQAHLHYRDPLWSFWLGWLRRLTCWLPQSELIWQELLLLRELRADRWAAQQVDPLLLAEALLQVVQAPIAPLSESSAAFGTAPQRLEERVNALLAPTEKQKVDRPFWAAGWLLIGCVPLLSLLLHR